MAAPVRGGVQLQKRGEGSTRCSEGGPRSIPIEEVHLAQRETKGQKGKNREGGGSTRFGGGTFSSAS